MKKYLFIAAAAVAMLASCSQSDDLSAPVTQQNTEDNAVQFGTYIGKTPTSRVAAAGLTTANLKSFGVFAFHSDGAELAGTDIPNFMFNQKVSGGSGSYTYTPVKYWPNQDGVNTNGTEPNIDRLSFFAYAPYSGLNDGTDASTSTANGIALTDGAGTPTTYTNTTTYTTTAPRIYYNPANHSYDNNVDVLYAVCQKNLTKPNLVSDGNPGVVTLNFKHALAKIGETVNVRYLLDKVNTGGTTGGTVELETNVVLKKVYIWIEGAADEIMTQGWLNLETGQWNDGTYSAAIENFTAAETAKLAMKDEDGSFAGLTSDYVTNANVRLTDFQGFLMIPAYNKEITIKARAVYDIETTDAALSGGKSTVENDITNSTDVILAPNKKYTINLVLGIETLKLDATVDDWTDTVAGDTEEIDLPINVSD